MVGNVGNRVVWWRAVAIALVTVTTVSGCSLWRTDVPAEEIDPAAEAMRLEEERLAARRSLDQFEVTGRVAAGGTFEDVQFDYDSVSLDEASRAAITRNAQILGANPALRVEIEGHCDERGTSEYNLALGARRAKAVKDALVAAGVSASRLSTVSYGEELPLCKDSNDACWARNRRGHLVDVSR